MTTRTVDQWLITAPQETFEAILAVTAERSRQEDKGWTAEHDDEHGTEHLRRQALARLNLAQGDSPYGREHRRERLVQAAALLVAAIEVEDRKSQVAPEPSSDFWHAALDAAGECPRHGCPTNRPQSQGSSAVEPEL